MGLGPRFTGMGVLLPTAFLGLEALGAGGLEARGLGPPSLGAGGLAFGAAALLSPAGFLGAASGLAAATTLGVSGLVVLAVEGRLRGAGVDFLAAGVEGLGASGADTQGYGEDEGRFTFITPS